MIRLATVVAALALATPALAPASRASGAAPSVEQMVVFRDGHAVSARVRARGLTVRVGPRRCAVADGTALAALLRARPAPVRLRDYGSCSRRPRDAGGLFVRAIGPDRNRGRDGWVYKVGPRAATAGAADPTGPFGSGRLRPGARVTWFYCRLGASGCQRTLSLRASAEPGAVVVRVTGHDDEGHGVPVEGAAVTLGRQSAVTGPDGGARFAAAPGSYRVHAVKDGLIRSFAERVVVP